MKMLSRKTVSAFISLLVFTAYTTSNGSEISVTDQSLALTNMTRAVKSNIIGGDNVTKDKYPWFAEGLQADGSWHRCAGSLVSPEYVLTEAWCVGDYYYTGLSSFKIGALSRNNTVLNTVAQETIGIEKVTIHPNYDSSSLENDFALVKLSKRVNASITPVEMDQGTVSPSYAPGE